MRREKAAGESLSKRNVEVVLEQRCGKEAFPAYMPSGALPLQKSAASEGIPARKKRRSFLNLGGTADLRA